VGFYVVYRKFIHFIFIKQVLHFYLEIFLKTFSSVILRAHLFCVLLVSRSVLKTIQHRKHNLWHTIRNKSSLHDMVEGKMMGNVVVAGKGQNSYMI